MTFLYRCTFGKQRYSRMLNTSGSSALSRTALLLSRACALPDGRTRDAWQRRSSACLCMQSPTAAGRCVSSVIDGTSSHWSGASITPNRGATKMPRNAGINPIDRHVGKRIRATRERLGLNQRDVGKKLNVTYQQMQRYESGANKISAARLYLIAKRLNRPVGYFFEGLR